MFGIKKRDLETVVDELRSACEDLRELRCAQRLVNAWSTSYVPDDISGSYTVTITGGDGLSFISTSHTREDAGTAWNNEVTDGSTVNMDKQRKVHIKSLLNTLESLTAYLRHIVSNDMMLVCTR